MDLLLAFLFPIIGIGAYTSYTDMRYGLIKNKAIGAALVSALVLNIIVVLFFSFSEVPIRPAYFIDLIANVLISAAVGFTAWHFRVWSAADGKLFVAYASLIPLTFYSNSYFNYFPSFVILINTFFPVFVFLAAKTLVSAKKKDLGALAKKVRGGTVLKLALSIFYLSWVSRELVELSGFGPSLLSNLVIVIPLSYVLRDKMGTIAPLLLSSARVVLDLGYVASFQFIAEFAFLFAASFAIYIITALSGILFSREVPFDGLKSGMILSDRLILDKGRYKIVDEAELMDNRDLFKNKEVRIGRGPGGLGEGDIDMLNRLLRQKKITFSKIRVLQTVSFSPFLFIGVMITLLMGGSMLSLIHLF